MKIDRIQGGEKFGKIRIYVGAYSIHGNTMITKTNNTKTSWDGDYRDSDWVPKRRFRFKMRAILS